MSTAIGNAPEPTAEQPGGAEQTARGAGSAHTPGEQPAPAARSCANCGAAMAPTQDWCLQCGAAAPGILQTPRWRSTTAIAGGIAVLALGAAAAVYAAADQQSPKAVVISHTLALAPPATPPATTTPRASGGSKVAAPTTPGAPAKLPLPVTKTKLAKIPLTAITPTKTTPTTGTGTKTTPTGTTKTGSSEEGTNGQGAGAEASEPTALVLDTNAASTYNPYQLPASDFGDPSLTIDGDDSTGWTAVVPPTTAPRMAEGVLLDLNSPQKLAALELVTQTLGMTVQVYGSTAKTAPTSIVSQAWTPLSRPLVVAKHHTRIKLKDQNRGFRLVTLWISKAPTSAVGTPSAPGRVTVGELELFPTS